jgi:exodeoxyribonuclease VII large subunit
LDNKAKSIDSLQHRLTRTNPRSTIEQAEATLKALSEKLLKTQNANLEKQQHKLALLAQTLHTASPLATLGRGYAILKSDKQKVQTQCSDFKAGDKISATLKDGVVHCTVDQSIPELDL